MKKPNKGQWVALVFIVGSFSAIAFQALKENSTVTFFTPEEIYQDPQRFLNKTFRVSGLVMPGSRKGDGQNSPLTFLISDLQKHEFTVEYKGLIPDLFKEGQGVIVEGQLNRWTPGAHIQASLLLVKHSEVYDTAQDHSQMKRAKILKSILKKS